MPELNDRQKTALRMMRARSDRDLYEGASSKPGAGSGLFWVTYPDGESIEPLTRDDVAGLVSAGLIREKWPDCYVLAEKQEGKPA